ncbi:MAG: XRE family transcriptional regulator [Planctomycetes bacterium]|nr:XRE family transcriptional regulator [Planctomycetota bacterium]
MLTPTLQKGLQRYSIGDKIRSLRLRKRLGLAQLGSHTGLSPAMLSRLERGRVFPTLPTLLRIALVFNVGLEHFFGDDPRRRSLSISRKAERVRLPEMPGVRDPAYSFEALDHAAVDKKMSSWLAEFHPVAPGRARPHSHPGAEFVFVVAGKLGIAIKDEDELILDDGDAVSLDPSRPHSYRRIGATPCRALVVTVP